VEICIIAFSNIALDGRVLRQIESMSEIGRVTTIGYGSAPAKSTFHFSIPKELSYLPLTIEGIGSLLARNFDSAYRHTPAVKWCSEIVGQIEADVVVLNDVQTIGLIEFLNKETHVVMDMHEYAPEEMSDDWRFRLLLRRYYQYLCKTHINSSSLVTTVSKTIAAKFETTLGIRCHVVRNSCKYAEMSKFHSEDAKVKLVHAGLASKGRHLEIMVDAVSELPGFDLDLYLVPAPRQARYYSKLKKRINKVPNVKLCEPVKSSDLVKVLNGYDVGLLVIHPSNFSLANCLPNKLFEYIQARLMVVAGPTPDIKEIVVKYGLGLVTDDFSSASLQKSLKRISRQSIDEFKDNSDKAAHDLAFETDSEMFKDLVRNLEYRSR
jgi:glycosyltransferase involved in cell wall biosynthesis